ncbi:MAG: hypothetical protein HQM08_19155 [Candidatus Riflebacteria bacterium]|nr:hypothetical protein [Candidatus Riflebacteria bacterium]
MYLDKLLKPSRRIIFGEIGYQKNMTIIEGYVQPPPTRSPIINIPEANYTPVKDLLSVTDPGSSWEPTSVSSSSSTTTTTSTGSSFPASSSSPSVASPS